MQYYYDGQIRRYLTQIIRLFSNFVVKYGDGTLVRVPVIYGDPDRQAATIINQNSENAIVSTPKIAVYITGLELERDRLSDATFVGKLHFREREIDPNTNEYISVEGNNYTVERLMPSPYGLTLKMDIWAANTDQKLQILEQILVFFNPSLEIQTSDNYVDWTSLSVVELVSLSFTSRSVPVGTNSTIDVATITIKTPIWITPPAKVKKLGVITNIIANIFDHKTDPHLDYIEGLGNDPATGQVDVINPITNLKVSIGNYIIFVDGSQIRIVATEGVVNTGTVQLSWPGPFVPWSKVLSEYPGKFIAGLSKIFLKQPDGTEVVGLLSLNPLDDTVIVANWDPDTFPANTPIPGPVRPEQDWSYFDAIVDPYTFNPKRPNKENTDQPIVSGTRYLLVDTVGGSVRDTFIATSTITLLHTNKLSNKVNDHTLYVNDVEVISTTQPNPVFYNSISRTITGIGTGATFDVTNILSTARYSAVVNNPGSNYEIGDKIRVRGKKLGGTNIENDCIITVKEIGAGGSIISIGVGGKAIPKEYVIIPVNQIAVDSKVTYELNMNEDGPDAWKNEDNSDLVAETNDIIEWDGSKWQIVFSADEVTEEIVYQTNFYTRTQYKWNGVEWVKSFEGEYRRGEWRLTL